MFKTPTFLFRHVKKKRTCSKKNGHVYITSSFHLFFRNNKSHLSYVATKKWYSKDIHQNPIQKSQLKSFLERFKISLSKWLSFPSKSHQKSHQKSISYFATTKNHQKLEIHKNPWKVRNAYHILLHKQVIQRRSNCRSNCRSNKRLCALAASVPPPGAGARPGSRPPGVAARCPPWDFFFLKKKVDKIWKNHEKIIKNHEQTWTIWMIV